MKNFIIITALLSMAFISNAQHRMSNNPMVMSPSIELDPLSDQGELKFFYTESLADFDPSLTKNPLRLTICMLNIEPKQEALPYGSQIAEAFDWVYDNDLNCYLGTLIMPSKVDQSGAIIIDVVQSTKIDCAESAKMGFNVNIVPHANANGINKIEDDNVSIYTCAMPSVSSTQDNSDALHFETYPNPADEYVILQFNKTIQNANVSIHNISGHQYGAYNFSNQAEYKLDTSNLIDGMYIVKVNAEQDAFIKQISIINN